MELLKLKWIKIKFLFEDNILDEITRKLKLIGFLSVKIDPDGYRPGKINVITD